MLAVREREIATGYSRYYGNSSTGQHHRTTTALGEGRRNKHQLVPPAGQHSALIMMAQLGQGWLSPADLLSVPTSHHTTLKITGKTHRDLCSLVSGKLG